MGTIKAMQCVLDDIENRLIIYKQDLRKSNLLNIDTNKQVVDKALDEKVNALVAGEFNYYTPDPMTIQGIKYVKVFGTILNVDKYSFNLGECKDTGVIPLRPITIVRLLRFLKKG